MQRKNSSKPPEPSLDLVMLRPITPDDIEEVARLHENQNERPADRGYIRRCVVGYPNSTCLLDGRIVGFVYGRDFAPDILHLTNILVDRHHRGMGLGTRLLADLERRAAGRWASIILSNSELLPHPPRRGPRDFYIANGYSVLVETEHTVVFGKKLG